MVEYEFLRFVHISLLRLIVILFSFIILLPQPCGIERWRRWQPVSHLTRQTKVSSSFLFTTKDNAYKHVQRRNYSGKIMWQQTVFIAELWVARMVFIVLAQTHNSCRMHRTCDNAKQWLNGRNNDAEPEPLDTDTGTHDKTRFDYSQSDILRRWLSDDILVDWYWFHILQNPIEFNYEAAIVRSLLINQAAAVGVLFN